MYIYIEGFETILKTWKSFIRHTVIVTSIIKIPCDVEPTPTVASDPPGQTTRGSPYRGHLQHL